MKIVPACLGFTLATCASAALAQMSPNDVASFKASAGTYSAACGKAGAARAVVTVDSITIEVGDKRKQGKAEMASHSTFGRSPPPKGYEDFQVELMSSVGSLYVMQGKAGKYIVFPERATLEKHFGKGSLAGQFKRCA